MSAKPSPLGFFTGLLFLLTLGTAHADWHGALSYTTDYVYRGYSKSRGNPVAQGHLEYQGDADWFAGIGLSQVSFQSATVAGRADLEIKPYAGWTLPLSVDWKAELSASGYLYNGTVFGRRADYAEIYGAIHYRDWLSGSVSVAPDAYRRGVAVPNYQIDVRRDMLDSLQLSASLGYHQAGALLGQDYVYWSAGATWFVAAYLALDLRYVDARVSPHPDDGSTPDEFYPPPLENSYLFSVTVGF